MTRDAPGNHEHALRERAEFCLRVVRAAGELALRGFESPTRAATHKGHQDFLTESDGAVEMLIRDAIAKAYPADSMIGEEMGGTSSRNVWVIDPIDGTANFARGIAHYCVVIAFVSDEMVQFGTIFNPSTDELYFARRGDGATLNGKTIRAAPTDDFRAASVEMGWSTRIPNQIYIEKVGALLEGGANVRRVGSGALALAYVADGRSDGYAELHMNAWDCLAGLLLVQEAGGVVGPFLSLNGLVDGGPVFAAAPGVAKVMGELLGMATE